MHCQRTRAGRRKSCSVSVCLVSAGLLAHGFKEVLWSAMWSPRSQTAAWSPLRWARGKPSFSVLGNAKPHIFMPPQNAAKRSRTPQNAAKRSKTSKIMQNYFAAKCRVLVIFCGPQVLPDVQFTLRWPDEVVTEPTNFGPSLIGVRSCSERLAQCVARELRAWLRVGWAPVAGGHSFGSVAHLLL